MTFSILQGDVRHIPLADAVVDSCVTDPPYELGFMGKSWDSSGIAYSVDAWREVLRVLKPGAHLVAFGGTRTYHRMACAIEDAGFEIRDQMQWIYGSGFPKSLDVSKAIDKVNGAERSRDVVPQKRSKLHGDRPWMNNPDHRFESKDPASADGLRWQGWGTALKPANEPICLARKPLERGLTVAQNVLKWGTGGLNIDSCRVPVTDEDYARNCSGDRGHEDNRTRASEFAMTGGKSSDIGRWPANVIHDGSDEVLGNFPNTASGQPAGIKAGGQGNAYGHFNGGIPVTGFGDEGSAARFFYCAKASNHDREAGLREAARPTMGSGIGAQPNQLVERYRNSHPTVKPTDLMQYLCRLVTPPDGLVLDPFAGSGSTVKAALIERFRCIGIDINEEYVRIANGRMNQLQVKLF